jgi:hypothetical protein
MRGSRRIQGRPAAAIVANQTSETGPNQEPMRVVPPRWTRKSAIKITSAIGQISGEVPGMATSRPSIADSTEMAGVIIPSPYRSAVPASATTKAIRAKRGELKLRCTSAMSASTPPSPLLSARRTKVRYFAVTVSISAQKMSDRTPSTCSTEGAAPWGPRKHSRTA